MCAHLTFYITNCFYTVSAGEMSSTSRTPKKDDSKSKESLEDWSMVEKEASSSAMADDWKVIPADASKHMQHCTNGKESVITTLEKGVVPRAVVAFQNWRLR